MIMGGPSSTSQERGRTHGPGVGSSLLENPYVQSRVSYTLDFPCDVGPASNFGFGSESLEALPVVQCRP